ncbi:MAG: collagenase, partial [Chloroflexota bacterium]
MKRDLIRLSMMGWTLIACAVFNPRSTPTPPATAVAAITKTAPIRFTLPPPKTATPSATYTSTSTPTSTFTPTTTFTSTRILTATRTPTPTRTVRASATSTFTATPKTSIAYRFDLGVLSGLQTNIKTGGDTADKYFRIIGGDASAKVTVYAYNDFNALVKAEMDFYKLYGSTSSEDFVRSNWTAQVCGHGNIAVIFLPVSTTTCWDGEKTTTYTIVSHEYFHAQQGNLSGKRFAVDDPHAEVPSTGPVWLTEGSAEYFAYRALSNSKLINYSDKRKTILSRASRLSVSLSDLETHQDFVSYADEGSYQLGFLAVEYLVTNKGDWSLLKFYKAIGGGTTWKTAFKDTFGKSIDDFYTS